MTKISVETMKEAAQNTVTLMESASPEVRLILENPQFALGLCIVLHDEVVELRKRVAAVESQAFQNSRSANSQEQSPASEAPPQPQQNQQNTQDQPRKPQSPENNQFKAAPQPAPTQNHPSGNAPADPSQFRQQPAAEPDKSDAQPAEQAEAQQPAPKREPALLS